MAGDVQNAMSEGMSKGIMQSSGLEASISAQKEITNKLVSSTPSNQSAGLGSDSIFSSIVSSIDYMSPKIDEMNNLVLVIEVNGYQIAQATFDELERMRKSKESKAAMIG